MFDFGCPEQTEKLSEPLKKYKSKKNKVLSKLINTLKIPIQHFLGCFSKKKSWEICFAWASPLGESSQQLNWGL